MPVTKPSGGQPSGGQHDLWVQDVPSLELQRSGEQAWQTPEET